MSKLTDTVINGGKYLNVSKVYFAPIQETLALFFSQRNIFTQVCFGGCVTVWWKVL